MSCQESCSGSPVISGSDYIHHLNPPYSETSQRCHDSDPFFRTIKPVTLFGSFKSLTFRLWDEQRNVL